MGAEYDGVLTHGHVVVPCALDGERRARGIELEGGARGELTQIERDVARRHAELNEVRLLVVEAELRAVGCAHERPWPDLDLHVGALPGVEHVTRRQRRVELGRCPVLRPGTPEGHLAGHVAHPGRRGVGRLSRVLGLDR